MKLQMIITGPYQSEALSCGPDGCESVQVLTFDSPHPNLAGTQIRVHNTETGKQRNLNDLFKENPGQKT